MLIVPKWLKLQTSNSASILPRKPDMTTEKISEREHGKGHVTVTTVPVTCNCSNGTDIPPSKERILVNNASEHLSIGLRDERTRVRLRLRLGLGV